MTMIPSPLKATALCAGLLSLSLSIQAQTSSSPGAGSDVPPNPSNTGSGAAGQGGGSASSTNRGPAAASPSSGTQRVDVTSGRPSDQQERRNATASKIVIGRQELEQFGDSNTLEILRRLPGITMPGAPGRGGPPRMRGLGAGYTQILMDGERVPPGFSLENVAPDQIERIEILRAPTAETGARAIGGTINIVMREGYRRRLNDLRLGLGYERGQWQPGASWTRNDTIGQRWIYNLTATAFKRDTDDRNVAQTTSTDLATGRTLLAQEESARALSRREGFNVNGRLQWRGETGDSALIMPMFIRSSGTTDRTSTLTQSVGSSPIPYATSDSRGSGIFELARVGANLNLRMGNTRTEWRVSANRNRFDNQNLRREFGLGSMNPVRVLDDDAAVTDRGASLNFKASRLLENQHSLVGGFEVEQNRRDENRTTLQNGVPLLADFGENVSARSQRLAAYAQDEWSFSPQWSAYAGLRWEGIDTEGDSGMGNSRNRSSVWTPLAHTVWKFDPKGRDQIRVSLTRSYKSPTLQNLIARPSLNSRLPAPGPNSATQADRAGNPDLRPELATGIDVAIERYLSNGGILSANVFHRELKDYIRNVTALENVPWSTVPRWVSRPQNVGGAYTQGIELEAKFRLTDFIAAAPRIDVRSNLSVFNSKVDAVPGPNARLDEQPRGTLNLGGDYRVPGLPLNIGTSVNFTPGYETRVTDTQFREVGLKKVWDAYATVNLNPNTLLRLTASNFIVRDYVTGSVVVTDTTREAGRLVERTPVNLRVGLEFKL
ncbi:MAG: TonB-dependent receptor [Betaproteobacteria bacterium]|nr:TonB-dependent receptor [Betaproteobacteria bacterium]